MDQNVVIVILNSGATPAIREALKAKLQAAFDEAVGSSRVDLQACKLEYSIVSPK